MRFLMTLCVLALAAPCSGQDFSVRLGGKTLGKLSYSENGSTAQLRSTLNSTPMGVFNGTFTGTSSAKGPNATFTGVSSSSRKERRVVADYTNGRVNAVDITPADERTDMSDPVRVSATVTDPVRAVGQLMHADECPAAIRLYDGRRVVLIAPTGKTQGKDALICKMSYKVTQGPGHLSPLRISSAKMELRYFITGGRQSLQHIKISSGVFGLSLDRLN